ncbi:MAG: hypothetical protein ABI868_13790 [Acidobacteriota bacterium]
MRHLTSEQLVDLAEAGGNGPSLPHLESCAACRQQLAELRVILSAVAEVDVPEPSPLFWTHFSARVHAAVESERAEPSTRFWRRPAWRVAPLWVGSLAVALFAVVIMMRGLAPDSPLPRPVINGVTNVVAEPPADVAAMGDDESLSLVADLVTGLDWDGTEETGLATDPGIADDVVAQLSDGELRELHQLLRMELGRPPA